MALIPTAYMLYLRTKRHSKPTYSRLFAPYPSLFISMLTQASVLEPTGILINLFCAILLFAVLPPVFSHYRTSDLRTSAVDELPLHEQSLLLLGEGASV